MWLLKNQLSCNRYVVFRGTAGTVFFSRRPKKGMEQGPLQTRTCLEVICNGWRLFADLSWKRNGRRWSWRARTTSVSWKRSKTRFSTRCPRRRATSSRTKRPFRFLTRRRFCPTKLPRNRRYDAGRPRLCDVVLRCSRKVYHWRRSGTNFLSHC